MGGAYYGGSGFVARAAQRDCAADADPWGTERREGEWAERKGGRRGEGRGEREKM